MFGDEGEPTDNTGYGGNGDMIGALINAGAMLYDSHQNRKQSEENTKMTIAAQKSESELAYQRQVAQIAAQNLYNSPEKQMERFMAAGLNPHLIYGRGSEGNQQGIAQYQPANLRYQIEPRQYGAAFASILPTLMSVGSWMQGMRLSDAQIRKTNVDTSRAEQIVGYLEQANPELLLKLKRESEGVLERSNYTFQQSQVAQARLKEMARDFEYKYGEDMWSGARTKEGGLLRLKYLEQAAKTQLEQAKASWTDYSVTNPQALMQLVLSGVMGMAGMQIRQSGRRPATTTHSVTETMRGGRTRTRQRIYQHGR